MKGVGEGFDGLQSWQVVGLEGTNDAAVVFLNTSLSITGVWKSEDDGALIRRLSVCAVTPTALYCLFVVRVIRLIFVAPGVSALV